MPDFSAQRQRKPNPYKAGSLMSDLHETRQERQRQKRRMPRETGEVPKVSHAAPVRETSAASRPEPKPVHPSQLFTDRAPKPPPAKPAGDRPSDHYVTGPGRKSVMTGKTSEEVKKEEEKAEVKEKAEALFRSKYNPYRPAARF